VHRCHIHKALSWLTTWVDYHIHGIVPVQVRRWNSVIQDNIYTLI